MRQTRFPEIDAIKVMGVFNMLLVHAMRPPWVPEATRLELWYGSVFSTLITPSFLFCAGCLAARPMPLPTGKLRQRLWRLLGPYVLASVLALAFRDWFLNEPVAPLSDLLLANAFGPYYFVFHMAWLIPLSYVLTRIPSRGLMGLWLVLLVGGTLRDIALWSEGLGLSRDVGFMVMLRNPLVFWGFFVSGFVYRGQRASILGWVTGQRRWLAPALLAVSALCALEAWTTPRSDTPALTYPLVYALLGLMLCVRWSNAGLGSKLRAWLGDRTYSLFLFHLFFVLTAQTLLPQPPHALDPFKLLAHVGAGFVGVLLLVIGRDQARQRLGSNNARTTLERRG